MSTYQIDNTNKSYYKIILILILSTFFIKGLFMVALFPIFQGPDEQIHYATIQYYAEPKEKNWPTKILNKANKSSDISTYNFSEEIIKTAKITKFDEIKWKRNNTQIFSDTYTGLEENQLIHNTWKQYIDIYPPNITHSTRLYSFLASTIEILFNSKNILVKFYLVRIFSVVIGTLIIYLSYLISRKIGISPKNSLLIATIISFQPMFSFVSAIINPDILLVFAFTLFLFGSASVLKDGINWKTISIAILSILIGIFTKGPGLFLIIAFYPVLIYKIYQKINSKKLLFLIGFIAFPIIILLSLYPFIPKSYTNVFTHNSTESKFTSFSESISRYRQETIKINSVKDTMLSYWGNFGWLDTKIPRNIIDIIGVINIIAIVGIIIFLITKKEKKCKLPDKKFIIFFIFLIILLQLAIRFYDWIIFDRIGKISIGTPGRYFLPNIVGHFIVLFIGLAAFFRKEIFLEIILKLSLILMVGLYLCTILNIIIPRYYL